MQPILIAVVTVAAGAAVYRLGRKVVDEYRWRKNLQRCAIVREARIAGRG